MRTGRPKKLNETKRAQLVALVAAGVGLRGAARLVGCNRGTIQNEARRNRQFALALKRAQSQAQLHPLRTMQEAAASNWRAAAWWLERLAPETFAQPVSAILGKREANKFVADLIEIIERVVTNPHQREQMYELLSAAMPAAMRRAWNHRHSRRKLEQALDYFGKQQRSGSGPRLDLGLPDPLGGDSDELGGGPVAPGGGPVAPGGEPVAPGGEPVEPWLAPDPQTERDIQRVLASLGERLVDRSQDEKVSATKKIEQEEAEEAERETATRSPKED